jgi:hypothetical protein
LKVIVILSIAKDLKSASKCIHVVVNRSFAMLRMTKTRASAFKPKRFGV